MSMTGVEVPVDALANIAPDTILVAISDEKGKVRVVKVDPQSVPLRQAILRVAPSDHQLQGGCWVRNSGGWTWMNPCPY